MLQKNRIRETISDNPEDKRKRLYELTALGREVIKYMNYPILHCIASGMCCIFLAFRIRGNDCFVSNRCRFDYLLLRKHKFMYVEILKNI